MRYLSEENTVENNNNNIKVDLKDRKILYLLGINARIPINFIAKKVGLSKDSISYRIKRLEKAGIIKGTRALINASFFGYTPYHLFIRLKNPIKSAENEIVSQLKKLPCARAILKFYGAYDLQVAIIARSIEEFDKISQKIISIVKEYLEEYEILIISKYMKVGSFHNGFYEAEKVSLAKDYVKKDIKIDSKDMDLLRLLSEDARISLLELSSKLKTSPDTVAYRIKKLENKVITGYVPVISFGNLGYNMSAILLTIHNLDETKEELIKHFCKSYPTVLWGVKTVGKYNIMIYVCTKNQEELQETITHIRGLYPGDLKECQSLLGVADYLYTYAPEILFKT